MCIYSSNTYIHVCAAPILIHILIKYLSSPILIKYLYTSYTCTVSSITRIHQLHIFINYIYLCVSRHPLYPFTRSTILLARCGEWWYFQWKYRGKSEVLYKWMDGKKTLNGWMKSSKWMDWLERGTSFFTRLCHGPSHIHFFISSLISGRSDTLSPLLDDTLKCTIFFSTLHTHEWPPSCTFTRLLHGEMTLLLL
jgi:hypothetical protein